MFLAAIHSKAQGSAALSTQMHAAGNMAFLAANKQSSVLQLYEPLTTIKFLVDLNKWWTGADLERSGSVHLVSYPLADNLCWVHKIIQDGIMDL